MATDDTRASDPPPLPLDSGGNDDTIPASDEVPEGSAKGLPSAKRYRIGPELGRGGMGRVVEAFDLQLGRTVALKEVLANRSSAGVERRFLREVQITARLEHPAIVPLYDSGVTDDGRPFYVMRKVTGRPLDELIARTSSVADRLAQLPAVLAAIDAIGHAHRRGVIHRDLKPANILVGELGETVVIDWGLAKVIGERPDAVEAIASAGAEGMTQLGSVFGTPGFMAPEQARGEELGARGDVYALGATLYQLLAGKPPHRGSSATEVLSSTMNNELVPLDRETPGTPADLVAIVNKAMAFEADARYPDAAALGEDVRRFLAGQLVAAHAYTPRQRLARFAKRHRAVLGVAAVASVFVAGLAWYGVHRILDERDLADAARTQATEESATVKRQLVVIQDRDEKRIIANARSLVVSNPTGAIAMLKQLPPGSKHVDEARTVAQSAVARGVVWGQQTTSAITFQALLSPDGSSLFQLTNDGWARLWDLDHHNLRWQRRESAATTRVEWIGDGKHLLLIHPKSVPQLVDIDTVVVTDLPSKPMRDAVAASVADRVLYVDDDGMLHRLDVGARADARLPVPKLGPHVSLAIAPDGGAFAVLEPARTTVYSADGAELTHRDGDFHVGVFSTTGRFALFGSPLVAELTLGPTPAWLDVPVPPHPKYSFAYGAYLGDELQLVIGSDLYAWRKTIKLRMALEKSITGAFALAGEIAVMQVSDAKLRYATAYEQGEIPLPMSLRKLRLLGRPKQQRLVAIGDGVLFDLPMANFVSHAVPKELDERPYFLSNDQLMFVPSAGDTVRWHDLRDGHDTVAQLERPGYHEIMSTDPADGRVLMVDTFGSVNGAHMETASTRLLLLQRGETHVRTVATGQGLWGLLLENDALMYADGKGTLFGAIGAAEPKQVGPFDGGVIALVGRGAHAYAAYTDKGALVRGSLDHPGAEEKIYGRRAETCHLAIDFDNRVYAAIGSRLYRWERDLDELHDFGRPIVSVARGRGGLVVGLDGQEFFDQPYDGRAPTRLLSVGSTRVGVSDEGSLLLGFGQSTQLQIVELPSQSMWSVPASISATGHASISPTSRALVYEPDALRDFALVVTLPRGPADLGAWLDELTNATTDEGGFVIWPWQ